MKRFDWAGTPIGIPEFWPQSLKTAVRIMLTSQQPIWIGWGEALIYLYNDPYKSIIGGKHPWALGRPASVVWREIWGDIGPLLAKAMAGDEGTYVEAQLLIMERNGFPEETYYTFSYSPIPTDDGSPGGIFCANTDDTQRVISERRLASLGPLLQGIETRIVDEDGNVLPSRGVGVIELRSESVTPGYLTMAGFMPAQDEQGWYDTGDLGYQMENGHVIVCGRVKDVIIMAGRNIYPTDIERAAGRVEGVRIGCAVAVRLDAGHSRETFAVAVESNAYQDPVEVRRIEHQVAHEVVTEVDVRPRNVVVLGPGTIPKTSSGKLRRANSVTLVT